PLQVDHGITLALRSGAFIDPNTGDAFGIVGRTQDLPRPSARITIGGVEVIHNLALVPDMVASGEHVAAQVKEFVSDRRCDTEAAGSMFCVGDYQIDFVRLHHVGDMIANDLASCAAENIANE